MHYGLHPLRSTRSYPTALSPRHFILLFIMPASANYMIHRHEALHRLKVEQLPAIKPIDEWETDHHLDLNGRPPIRMIPVPGRRCGTCLAKGQTVWVIPGKRCPQCGTEVQ
ncbi:Hypothetical protein R9X50_00031100 [Acrodontium crateriforme]|uniref:Uncharacterized protein n=1 Tax=Acrodontium crateriforme TaxID=150365 RepID=A0AAQ3LX84_9PEZI|nr:Hypothetical protein R9X50_00031100 [Acrodontium crateriforme]